MLMVETHMKPRLILMIVIGLFLSVIAGSSDDRPTWKSIDLQNKLSELETEIERSRRFYNAIVVKYNTKCEMFPSNIIAGIFGFKRKPLYEIQDAAQRENVKVQF